MAKYTTAKNPAIAPSIPISQKARIMLIPIKESEAIAAETMDSVLKNSLVSFKSFCMFLGCFIFI